MSDRPAVSILGTRGVPPQHGGFETLAARLALDLVARGWDVRVYCQTNRGERRPFEEDGWHGVRRVHVPTRSTGAVATLEFDMRSTLHAMRRDDLKLVLGYNTAVFNLALRAAGRTVVMNMDGLEWQRSKWGRAARAWLRANEWIGARTSHRLIADHPEIERHLRALRPRAPIRMIPYGADAVGGVPDDPLRAFALDGRPYLVVVARIEPENSILEIVRGFSSAPTGARLVVLGALEPARNAYHARVLAAASDECLFPGAIYDPTVVPALRAHAVAYAHGHTVGGTNPSLVEALGAGSAVIAHDNPFNRWVAGDAALYFADEQTFRAAALTLLADPAVRDRHRAAAAARHAGAFLWPTVLDAYAELLAQAWTRRDRA